MLFRPSPFPVRVLSADCCRPSAVQQVQRSSFVHIPEKSHTHLRILLPGETFDYTYSLAPADCSLKCFHQIYSVHSIFIHFEYTRACCSNYVHYYYIACIFVCQHKICPIFCIPPMAPMIFSIYVLIDNFDLTNRCFCFQKLLIQNLIVIFHKKHYFFSKKRLIFSIKHI